MNNLPKNLKYLRKQRGLKQEEMLEELGFLRSTWSNYENGKTDPAVEDLIRFSSFFGISLDALILHDLAAAETIPDKTAKKAGRTRPVTYTANDTISMVAEEGLEYVLKEIKQLRKDVNSIKDGRKKK